MKKLTIGLFGFGVVGEGIYNVLNEKTGLGCEVKYICIKHPDKKRNAPSRLFTTDADVILEDPDVNVVVELIDNAEEAYHITSKAMCEGKHVVSANKKMIATYLDELIQIRDQHQVSFLYEGAVCGSVPIIRNLEEYFDNDLLESVGGIVNGSTNYILSEMSQKPVDYVTTLSKAQELGFAESDPSLDVDGYDAAYKLSIILSHAFGRVTKPEEIIRKGISSVSAFDFKFAREKQQTIKLIAQAQIDSNGQLLAQVLPCFVGSHTSLYQVNAEYNAVEVGSALADKQLFIGKGAGRLPTSSAVLSDISALKSGYRYEYKKLDRNRVQPLNPEHELMIYIGYRSDDSIDYSLFEEVQETHSSQEGNYVIGKVRTERLIDSPYWSSSTHSIILMNSTT